MKPNAFHLFAAQTDTRLNVALIVSSLVVGAIFIAALTFVPRRARKPLIAAITFIAGLYFSLEYLIPSKATAEGLLRSTDTGAMLARTFLGWPLRLLAAAPVDPDENWLSPTVQGLTTAWQVIAGFTFALGIWNLVHIHGKSIIRAQKNWPYSVFFFAGLIFMALAGFASTYGLGPVTKSSPYTQAVFQIATEGMFFSLDAAMFSLIAFFIISAAYRAFRIRSFESSLMMTAAFLVMLGQVPIGIWLTSWIGHPGWSHIPLMGWFAHEGWWSNLRLENISYWILTQPNAAAQRGINFGLAVGGMAMGLRIWLSLERGSYFEKEV